MSNDKTAETSAEARPTPSRQAILAAWVLLVLHDANGPQTAHWIAARTLLLSTSPPSGVRTRLSEWVKLGVVAKVDDRGTTPTGRRCTRYGLTGTGRLLAANPAMTIAAEFQKRWSAWKVEQAARPVLSASQRPRMLAAGDDRTRFVQIMAKLPGSPALPVTSFVAEPAIAEALVTAVNTARRKT